MKTVISTRILVVLSFFTFGLGLASAQTSNTCVSQLNNYSKFTVLEAAEYKQTNAAGAFPSASNSFLFEASIALETNLTASEAMVTIPNFGQEMMTMTDPSHFVYGLITNSFSNLNSAFPAGDYEFIISNKSISITLPEDITLPNAPTLTNYAAAQAINATQDFTLSWVPFSGGRSQDFISVNLISLGGGAGFKTGDFGCPEALDGTASSILIPANTLGSNQNYLADITFVKVLTLDTNTVAGDALLAGTEALSEITVSTGPGPSSAPVLTNLAWLPGGSLRFDLATTPGLTYTVQFNENLGNPAGWTSLLVTNVAVTSLSFTNTPPVGDGAGFYRASHN